MEKDFVPYEQAVALKELGFDEECFAWYVSKNYGLEFGKVIQSSLIKDAIIAPTYSQAFRLFREKHGLIGWVSSKTLDDGKTIYIPHGRTIPNTIKKNLIVDIIPYYVAKEYEEAELECLKKLIEIVKEQK